MQHPMSHSSMPLSVSTHIQGQDAQVQVSQQMIAVPLPGGVPVIPISQSPMGFGASPSNMNSGMYASNVNSYAGSVNNGMMHSGSAMGVAPQMSNTPTYSQGNGYMYQGQGMNGTQQQLPEQQQWQGGRGSGSGFRPGFLNTGSAPALTRARGYSQYSQAEGAGQQGHASKQSSRRNSHSAGPPALPPVPSPPLPPLSRQGRGMLNHHSIPTSQGTRILDSPT